MQTIFCWGGARGYNSSHSFSTELYNLQINFVVPTTNLYFYTVILFCSSKVSKAMLHHLINYIRKIMAFRFQMDSRLLSLGIIWSIYFTANISADIPPPIPLNFFLHIQLPIEDKHLILEWKKKKAGSLGLCRVSPQSVKNTWEPSNSRNH